MPQTKKVLIIDDNAQNRKLARDLLEIAGHVVLETNHATHGIELAKDERPDLILMDYQLPETDGIEAAKKLKGDGATTNIPIVVITASAIKEEVQSILDTGLFIKIITKPINTRTFVKEVLGVLES